MLKTSDPEAIATAIRQAFEPSLFLARPQERTVPTTDNQLLGKLTRRELEILQLVSGGRSNRQVAEILWVADQTVKFHLANIYRKLGVGSRFEAARWARESGILDVVVEPDAGTGMSEGSGSGGITRALFRFGAPGRGRGTLGEDSGKHRDDAQRVLPSPDTAASNLRGVPAGRDPDGKTDQILDGGRSDREVARRLERERA